MNISKEVLELDFNKIYDSLELESKNGYNKYIKYLELPKCITSFLMYCCDVVSSRYKPFDIRGKIFLIKGKDIKIQYSKNSEWYLYDLYNNTINVSKIDVINFNKQLPE